MSLLIDSRGGRFLEKYFIILQKAKHMKFYPFVGRLTAESWPADSRLTKIYSKWFHYEIICFVCNVLQDNEFIG